MIHRLTLRLTLIFSIITLSSCASWYAGEADEGVPVSVGTIQTIWSVDVDQREPGEPAGFSQAAVVPAHGSSQELIVIGGRDSRVRVYDLSGRELHRITIHEPSDSGALALSNGLVVLSDVGGMLYGIDPVQGNIAWEYQLSSPFLAQPVLLNDGFLIQTMDNRIYHFSLDGSKLWSYAGQGAGLGMYMTASPLVVDHTVYVVFTNGNAVALKADSGDLLWRRQLLLNTDAAVLSELRAPISTPVHLNQAVLGIEKTGDTLLVAFYQGKILVLSRVDGAQLFAKDVSTKSSPLIDQGHIYIANASGEVEAIDLVSGATVWKNKFSDGELLGPVAWKDALWVADDRGIVMRLGRDGRQQASVTLNGRIERAPIVTSAGLLARTGLGVLTLLR
ncbi:MAG: PQQ-binding-like beta-propeller repeat protein, partial [Mariprofundaceae bacterium]